MKENVKILIVEDLPSDAVLAEVELKKVLSNFTTTIVETENEFLQALNEFIPDLIISDYSLPGFDGLTALKLTLRFSPLTPFIILTGSMNEETAVECMKAGAADYVIKEHIKRLGASVLHALAQKEIMVDKMKAEEEIIENHRKLNTLFNNLQGMAYRCNNNKKWTMEFLSNGCEELTGYHIDDLLFNKKVSYNDLIHSEDRERIWEEVQTALNEKIPFELSYRIITADQRIKWVNEKGVGVFDENSGELIALEGFIWDVTDKKIAEEKLKESEEKFRRLFETSIEGIVVGDINEKIILVNPRMTEMTGYSKNELLNMNFKDLLPEEEITDHLSRKKFRAEGISDSYERKLLKKDGTIIWTTISASPIIEENGKYNGAFGMITDITEKKRLIEELIEAKEKAEASDKLKSEFLAMISHEVRTPLNAIVNYTSWIKDEMCGDESNEFYDIIDGVTSSTLRLERTIHMILDTADLHTHAYTPNKKSVDIYNDVTENVMREMRAFADSKKLDLRVTKLTENTTVFCDEYSVLQTFINLVDNAIKYTEKGRIDIRLLKNQYKQLTVEIEDTGIGMTEDYIEHIYEPFSQEETGYTRSHEGSGLGLTLVKKYCELNNIQIKVNSKKDEGTKLLSLLIRLCKYPPLRQSSKRSYSLYRLQYNF